VTLIAKEALAHILGGRHRRRRRRHQHHLFIHSFTFIHSFIYPFICLFIRSFIHSLDSVIFYFFHHITGDVGNFTINTCNIHSQLKRYKKYKVRLGFDTIAVRCGLPLHIIVYVM